MFGFREQKSEIGDKGVDNGIGLARLKLKPTEHQR